MVALFEEDSIRNGVTILQVWGGDTLLYVLEDGTFFMTSA
jgi:hypothetical protein